jgi:hypothetical protein
MRLQTFTQCSILEVADDGAHIGVVALVLQVTPCKILHVLGALLKPMYSYNAVCFHFVGLFSGRNSL